MALSPQQFTQFQNLIQQFLSRGDSIADAISRATEQLNVEIQPIEAASALKTFTNFDSEEDIVSNVVDRVTDGMWTGGTGSIDSFFTSSTQSGSSGNWYYDVYRYNPQLTSSAEVQFAVAYGHSEGSGSPSLANDNNSNLPTKAIYSQYANILLAQDDETFTFAGNVDSKDIYVVNIERARLKQKMDAGNWQIDLLSPSSALTMSLIDDSSATSTPETTPAGRVYNVVTGSLNLGAGTATIATSSTNEPSGGLGLFWPDRGIVILHPTAVSHSLGLEADLSDNKYANNHGAFLDTFDEFIARNEEQVTSQHFFVRVKNKEYNFSNNPTFVTGSEGELKFTSFIGDPKTYITTIGLYNDSNELVAVAKVSQPIRKEFEREALIKVKISY